MSTQDLISKLQQGDLRALARAISLLESGQGNDGPAVVDALGEQEGQALRIGLTGPPGAGKSTLADRLIAVCRSQGKRVAVLAVDPSSPMTGGALLGDRIRMGRHDSDAGVFIRSMATRGSIDGLAMSATMAVDLLDAFGFDVVLVETAGVGQVEVAVRHAVDVVVLVIPPGSGDIVQAMKAGLNEVADFLVVNKSDLPGAEQTVNALQQAWDLTAHDEASPKPSLISAEQDLGIADLWQACQDFVIASRDSGAWQSRRQERFHAAVRLRAEDRLRRAFWNTVDIDTDMTSLSSVETAANDLVQKFLNTRNE